MAERGRLQLNHDTYLRLGIDPEKAKKLVQSFLESSDPVLLELISQYELESFKGLPAS